MTAQALGTHTAPATSLKLEYVHGYNGSLTLPTPSGEFRSYSNNLVTLKSGEVVFPAASTCVVFNYTWNTQRFFLGHSGPVTCVALHPNGRIVASGQVGHKPPVCIWDSMPGPKGAGMLAAPAEPRHIANLMRHTVGLTCLAFSPDGLLLASVGGDARHTVRCGAGFGWLTQCS